MTAPELPRRIWVFDDVGGGIPRSGIWIDEQSECPDGSPEYTRADIAAAMVAAEREAIATMIEATAYTINGDGRSLKPVSDGLQGMDMHHATIAAAIRNRGKS